ncbi:hypothetical protein M440DRAFT_324268 [Trichoderma longibrachiatum ATCC 18648]|uniref:Uncharacterized protein n=1 Tax=Trichoderma longibrachiatum ATCC 18648 TaxID=983965 RepID=A0A2T4C1R4_TRILO|nr:hypothetical protein M440DRAFT_324268 [Trichoderma longibrachiatum ATCC 18648]
MFPTVSSRAEKDCETQKQRQSLHDDAAKTWLKLEAGCGVAREEGRRKLTMHGKNGDDGGGEKSTTARK